MRAHHSKLNGRRASRCLAALTGIVVVLSGCQSSPSGTADDGTFDAESYWAGERLTIVTSYDAGGTGDVYARVLARHLPDHIPGSPKIVVENRPGGGHNIANNLFYSSVEPDGKTVMVTTSSRVIGGAIGEEGVNYDASKYRYIASLQSGGHVCFASKASGITSIEDLAEGKEWIIGSVSPSASASIVETVMAKDKGWNTRLILPYESTPATLLAVQAGEINGGCVPYPQLASDATVLDAVVPLFIIGTERLQQLPDVPATSESDVFGMSEEAQAAVDAYTLRFNINLPVVLPPGTPDAVFDALTEAFEATRVDPEYVAESEKSGFTIEGWKSRDDVETSVEAVFKVPASVWEILVSAQEELGR